MKDRHPYPNNRQALNIPHRPKGPDSLILGFRVSVLASPPNYGISACASNLQLQAAISEGAFPLFTGADGGTKADFILGCWTFEPSAKIFLATILTILTIREPMKVSQRPTQHPA